MRSYALICFAFLLCGSATSGVAAADHPNARKIDFTLPFAEALEKAKTQERLIFLKPIFGGVDAEGAADYRSGSW